MLTRRRRRRRTCMYETSSTTWYIKCDDDGTLLSSKWKRCSLGDSRKTKLCFIFRGNLSERIFHFPDFPSHTNTDKARENEREREKERKIRLYFLYCLRRKKFYTQQQKEKKICMWELKIKKNLVVGKRNVWGKTRESLSQQ